MNEAVDRFRQIRPDADPVLIAAAMVIGYGICAGWFSEASKSHLSMLDRMREGRP